MIERNLNLNPKQSLVWSMYYNNDGSFNHNCPQQLAFFGGIRSGKSFCTALLIHSFCLNFPNITALFSRNTYRQLVDTTVQQFLGDFPPDENSYVYKAADQKMMYSNGSQLLFRAYDSPDKILSMNLTCAAVTQAESMSEEMYLLLCGRLSDKGKGMPNVLILEGNPAESFVKYKFVHPFIELKKDQNLIDSGIHQYVKITAKDNEINLPKNYLETLHRLYPPDYISRFIDGDWSGLSDTIYTGLSDENIKQTPKIQDYWQTIVAFDHGTVNNSHMLWISKDEHGNIWVWDEWHKKNASISDLYNAANKNGRFLVVADYSIKTRQVRGDGYGSVWNDLLLYKNGLKLMESHKHDKQANIMLVNSLFHTGKLFFNPKCTTAIKEHKSYQWKKVKVTDSEHRKDNDKIEGTILKIHDHSVDACQYGIRYLNSQDVTNPHFIPYEKPKETLQQAMLRDHKNNQDWG